MGRSNKRSSRNGLSPKADERRKVNRFERRKVQQYLKNGQYDLPNEFKFDHAKIVYDDEQ